MIAWLLYTVVVSALLGLAALAADAALTSRGRPVRWVWATALAGSLAVPVWAWLRPEKSVAVEEVVEGPVILQPATVLLDATATASSRSWDGVLLAVCVVASLAVVALLVVAHVRLAVARRGWGRDRVDGVPVYVSRDVGPAALGFFGGSIVIPEWALRLEERLRRLMLLHESEHVRAGDPRLLGLGLTAAAAMPWNPVVWWLLRRLRLAIELDCDARVLRREPDPRGYGALLLEVGRRFSGTGLVAAALAEPQSFLERRLRRLVVPKPRGWGRALAAGGAAVVLTVLACEAPEPTVVPTEEPAQTDKVVEATRLLGEAEKRVLLSDPSGACPALFVLDGVVLGPFEPGSPAGEVMSRLEPLTLERIEIVKGVAASGMAERLGFSGVCGVIQMWSKTGADGITLLPELDVSGGRPAADSASSRIVLSAEEIRIVPAERPEATAPVDASRFQALAPGMQSPTLRNQAEVEQALKRYYPPLLRDAGIGGTVMVQVWIDETGAVRRHEVAKSSGHPALDAAAQSVAATMEFEPARANGQPKRVVVQIPITFRVK
jgi:TonB family protein